MPGRAWPSFGPYWAIDLPVISPVAIARDVKTSAVNCVPFDPPISFLAARGTLIPLISF